MSAEIVATGSRSWTDRARDALRRAVQTREGALDAIAWSQLVGGALGILPVAIEALGTPRYAYPSWHLAAAAAAFGTSALAGWRLRRRRRGGVALSILVQLAQVAFVTTSAVALRFAAGLALTAWVDVPGGLDFVIGGQASFHLRDAAPGEPLRIGVNLFSLVSLGVLVRAMAGRREQTPQQVTRVAAQDAGLPALGAPAAPMQRAPAEAERVRR